MGEQDEGSSNKIRCSSTSIRVREMCYCHYSAQFTRLKFTRDRERGTLSTKKSK